MTLRLKAGAFFSLALFGLMPLPWQLKRSGCDSQSVFSVLPDARTHIRCPVVIPSGARAALARDPFIRDVMHGQSILDLPQEWFSATYVCLGAPGERDLLVIGDKGPLPGANVYPVWVLRPANRAWTIIVNGAPALGVRISQRRTNGYKDLVIGKATAVQVYTGILRFDGRVYRLATGFWAPVAK